MAKSSLPVDDGAATFGDSSMEILKTALAYNGAWQFIRTADSSLTKAERKKEAIEALGYTCPLVSHRSAQVKAYGAKCLQGAKFYDIKRDRGCSPYDFFVFDVPALLCLPADARMEALAELVAGLEVTQQAMRELSFTVHLQILNEKNKHGKVYGSIRLRMTTNSLKSDEDQKMFDKHAAAVDAAFSTPLMKEWLREVALSLGRIGPWSWTSVTEDTLFGEFQGPTFTRNFQKKRTSALI